MLFQKINLEQEDENVYLDAYVADEIPGFTRKAILVIPGGGYGAVCSDREGEPIAMAFLPYGYNKPAGMMLIYPVVTGVEEFGHHGSFHNLLGSKNPTEEDLLMCSLEKNVDEKTSPAFVVHTSNDQVVNVQNSLVLAKAFAQSGMKFELHIYPDGPHGVALGNRITRCGVDKWEDPCIAKWVEHAVAWAEKV